MTREDLSSHAVTFTTSSIGYSFGPLHTILVPDVNGILAVSHDDVVVADACRWGSLDVVQSFPGR